MKTNNLIQPGLIICVLIIGCVLMIGVLLIIIAKKPVSLKIKFEGLDLFKLKIDAKYSERSIIEDGGEKMNNDNLGFKLKTDAKYSERDIIEDGSEKMNDDNSGFD